MSFLRSIVVLSFLLTFPSTSFAKEFCCKCLSQRNGPVDPHTQTGYGMFAKREANEKADKYCKKAGHQEGLICQEKKKGDSCSKADDDASAELEIELLFEAILAQ